MACGRVNILKNVIYVSGPDGFSIYVSSQPDYGKSKINRSPVNGTMGKTNCPMVRLTGLPNRTTRSVTCIAPCTLYILYKRAMRGIRGRNFKPTNFILIVGRLYLAPCCMGRYPRMKSFIYELNNALNIQVYCFTYNNCFNFTWPFLMFSNNVTGVIRNFSR